MVQNYQQLLASIKLTPYYHQGLSYYLSGPNPKLLLGSGLHGNEYRVIPLLIKTILKIHNQLPQFLLIPQLSPSACQLKNRCNAQGIDVNRCFADNQNTDQEVLAIKSLVQKFSPYKTVLTIHEDLEKSKAYLYAGTALAEDKKIQAWQKNMQVKGINLLNGKDDPNDSALGVNFTNGVFTFNPQTETFKETFETWASLQAGAEKNLTLEIPHLATEKIRKYIIEQSILSLV